MIISHKHKFIFIKPMKVAGTSVEVALAKHCGKDDIITPITDYSESSDEDQYTQLARNYDGYYNHISPEEIKSKVRKKVWSSYKRITIVRNPWDQVISQYFWRKYLLRERILGYFKNILRNFLNSDIHIRFIKDLMLYVQYNFSYFLNNFRPEWINTRFYFDKNKDPVCDCYLKYENLENDYKDLCSQLGVQYEKLPRLKTKQRKKKEHYNVFFSKENKKIIENMFSLEIAYFHYKFEDGRS